MEKAKLIKKGHAAGLTKKLILPVYPLDRTSCRKSCY